MRMKDTTMRTAISPQERLALTLRFLATGETFRSLEFFFRISRKAISYIVVQVVTAIYDNLAGEFLALPPTLTEWEKIESRFREFSPLRWCCRRQARKNSGMWSRVHVS